MVSGADATLTPVLMLVGFNQQIRIYVTYTRSERWMRFNDCGRQQC